MRRKKESGTNWLEGLSVVAARKHLGPIQIDKRKVSWRWREKSLVVITLTMMGILLARVAYLQLVAGESNFLLAKTNSVKLKRLRAPRGIIFDRRGVALVKNVKDDKYGTSRAYPFGPDLAHLVGYVSEVRKDEIGCYGGSCYQAGMLIGRFGVEKSFESILRGVDGGEIWEETATGQKLRKLGEQKPIQGHSLSLSLDQRLQTIAYQALKQKLGDGGKGSVVALNMEGKVLALVSYPAFNPNLFTVAKNDQELKKILEDRKKQYFLNRAIGGSYPPGSIFKLVTAYAGLEEGKITAKTKIEDTGEIKVGKYRYGNWYWDKYGKKEGKLDVVGAIKRSNDIFFYKVGEEVGVKKLDEWARKFGLGSKTGIELEGEVKGLVPTPLWRERRTGERWFLGNTYHLAIGQGDLLVTPIQAARMGLAAISGQLCKVSVLKDSPISCEKISLSSKNIELVREGMKEACAPGGTAFPLFDFKPWLICKTGTAQHGGKNTKPHAWILVGYPGENPRMVLVVMLESAGEGSAEAGSVAKEILSRFVSL